MATMIRPTLAALAFVCGCGQDIDLGSTRKTALEPQPTPTSSGGGLQVAPCPFDDPALLQAPAACPTQLDRPLYTGVCLVTADGRAMDQFAELPRLPACPTGVYFTLRGSLPAVDNIERSVVVLKGEEYDKAAFDANVAPHLPRTIEVIPERNSFFVRLDPRPSNGLRVNVLALVAELFSGMDIGVERFNYANGIGFIAGDKLTP